MSDLDRILSTVDWVPAPSATFESEVMARVNREVRRKAFRTPLWPLALAVTALVVLTLVVAAVLAGNVASPLEFAVGGRPLWAALLIVVTALAAVLPSQLLDS